MSTSILASKNRVSLPGNVVEAARLRLNDEIFWTVERDGELRGRKLARLNERRGKVVVDRQTGLAYWQGGAIADTEAEDAALNANLSRHD
jgi:hypothetical protein